MSGVGLVLLRAALCAGLIGAAHAEAHGTAQWKGSKVTTDALPAAFPTAAVPAIELWSPWALEHGFKLELEVSGRALIVVGADAGAGKWVKAAENALRALDEHLPAPAREGAPGDGTPKPKGAGGAIPEDPGSGGSTSAPSGKPATTTWGAGTHALDTETFVLFVLRTENEHKALLDRMVEIAPYLGPWRAGAESLPGFALEEPLAGAVVLGARGQQEWNPENEAVHRAAELSLMRRFGRQPYWLLQGWAWSVELSVKRGIYCFPYRSGFVGVGEHTGWDKQLKLEWAVGAPTMVELGALRRGAWDARAAHAAWGTVTFLERYYGAGFVGALEQLRAAWDSGSRRELGGGRWEREADYQVPAEQQFKILAAHTSANFLAEVRGYFQNGSSYRPGR